MKLPVKRTEKNERQFCLANH